MVLPLHMVLGKCCHTCWSHKNLCEYHCNFQSLDDKMCSKHFHFSDNFLTLFGNPNILLSIFFSKRYSWNRVGCSTYARLDNFFVIKKALYYIKDEGSILGENMMKYSWRTKSVFENDTIFYIRPENRFKVHYDKTWKKQLVQFNYMTVKWNKWQVQFSYIVICSSHE